MPNEPPPCPRCGDEYAEFVRYDEDNNVVGVTIDRYAVLCSTGLGVYLHE